MDVDAETESTRPDDSSKKRTNTSTEKSSSKKTKKSKKSINRDNSSTLQRLIKELSSADPGNDEILLTELTSELNIDSNIFLNLYNKTQDVLHHYYDLGKHYRNSMIVIEN
jgi:hypothetical protein